MHKKCGLGYHLLFMCFKDEVYCISCPVRNFMCYTPRIELVEMFKFFFHMMQNFI